MLDCVVCAYPMIRVANGNLVDLFVKQDAEAEAAIEKHDIELKEGETPVGCYVCPECGYCVWLET